MQENDMKRRMMMESAINLEVDLGNLGLDEKPDVRDPYADSKQKLIGAVPCGGRRRSARVRVGPVS